MHASRATWLFPALLAAAAWTFVPGRGAAQSFVSPNPATNLDPALDPAVDPELGHYLPPAGDGRVVIQWDNTPECAADPETGLVLFEGYRLWKVANWTGGDPLPEEWVLLAEYRNDPEDGLGFASPNHLRRVVDGDVAAVDTTAAGCPLFPIGRYAFVDTEVENGLSYLYAVTSFGKLTLQTGEVEIPGESPSSPGSWAVTPCAGCAHVGARPASWGAIKLSR